MAQLTRSDRDRELVLLRRQRARRERRERARRIVGAVEIQFDDAIVRQGRVKIAPGLVRIGAVRQVLEDEEEILAAGGLVHRLETPPTAAQRELDVAGTLH